MMKVEVFRHPEDYVLEGYQPGWYYWYVHPGCLPDTGPVGPFDTALDANCEVYEELRDLNLQSEPWEEEV